MRVYANMSEVRCCNLATSGEQAPGTETISKACKHLDSLQHCSDKYKTEKIKGCVSKNDISVSILRAEEFLEQAQSMSTSDPELLIRSFSGRG